MLQEHARLSALFFSSYVLIDDSLFSWFARPYLNTGGAAESGSGSATHPPGQRHFDDSASAFEYVRENSDVAVALQVSCVLYCIVNVPVCARAHLVRACLSCSVA